MPRGRYALLEQDCLFHLRLFEAAAMPAVEPILLRCLVHTQRFKILHSKPQERDLLNTADRHVSIIDAIEGTDPDALRQALSHHIATIVDFGPLVLPSIGKDNG